MAVIGVDLGTTNSLCCVWKDGGCVLIPNSLGEYLTPSVVSVDEKREILTGKAARERLVTRPQDTAASFKQFMGTDKTYMLNRLRFHPEDLSAIILRRLKEDAELFLGEPVTEAVISVPAYFNNNQRTMTKIAGEMAGLTVERIINEPSAAALAYRHKTGANGTYLVVDFGGGTLDISVVEIFENIVDIIAVAGDNHLGGDNIDQALAEAFYKRHPGLKDKLSETEKASVLKMAEQSKINLSFAEQTMMVYVHEGKTYEMVLTNQLLADICAPILAKIKAVLLHALKDSGRHISAIDEIILVGGSGKMPVIKEYLTYITGKTPRNDIDPDKAIVLGVGIVTGIKARDKHVQDLIMTDICPFTLGTNIYDPASNDADIFSPIIERNTSLPVSQAHTYTTVRDFQTQVVINVYQGESMSVKNNLLLGTITMPVPSMPAGKAAVVVRFTYDINGILEVDVTCLQSGEHQSKLIVTNHNLSDSELRERREIMSRLKTPPREQDQNRFLLERGARLYEESTGALRELVAYEMSLLSSVLERNAHVSEIEMARNRFMQFLNSVDRPDEEIYLQGGTP